MNERVLELAKQAGLKKEHSADREYIGDFDWREFAELIVRECAYVSEGYFGFKDHTPGTAIAKEMKEHFGIEETKGWVCPRCGVDRTKNVCPHGYTATIEGKCPMIGVAQ